MAHGLVFSRAAILLRSLSDFERTESGNNSLTRKRWGYSLVALPLQSLLHNKSEAVSNHGTASKKH
jgi:hypothetical protein